MGDVMGEGRREKGEGRREKVEGFLFFGEFWFRETSSVRFSRRYFFLFPLFPLRSR
jgi:hypothetical protein